MLEERACQRGAKLTPGPANLPAHNVIFDPDDNEDT